MNKLFEFELEILRVLQSLRTDTLNRIFELTTMLGEETPMILLIAILYFAVNKTYAQKLFFITAISLSTNCIIKNLVKLPRPFTKKGITCVRPETATGYSFPSGHTQNFTTWSTAIAIKFKKIWFTIIIGILIILIVFSRVYLGAHYISDVLVGAILGVLFAIIGDVLYNKIENKRNLYIGLILILMPFAIGFFINPNPLYEDFYKFFGMIIGLFVGMIFEEKYAPLEYNEAWWKKTIRVVIAIILAYVIKEGIKQVLVSSNLQISLMLEVIKYFILMFVIFGIYPMLLKKCHL